jgi:DNA-binding PadR family transcriptional regulator
VSASTALGELEVLLLLAILHLTEQRAGAYGLTIRGEIESRTGRPIPRGSIYVTLDRLEDKGLLASRDGGTSLARGHRPKRLLAQMQRGLEAVLGRV